MSSNSFVRFLLVGLVNTAVGYCVILLLHYGMGATALAANVGGFAFGAFVSYVLNRSFSFDSRRPHREALPRFFLALGVCFALNLAVLQAGLSILALPFAVAQALAVGTYTVAFYLASRLLVFRT